MAAFLTITMRGWWFPGRQLVTVLPLVAVLMAVALAEWRGRPALYILTGLLASYGLAVTIALRQATAAREVTLAVNPFEMDWGGFAKAGFPFPLYTSYEPVTWLLTVAWCCVVLALLWLAWRSAPLGSPAVALRRLRSWRPRSGWGQKRSAARLQESESSW